MDRGAAKIPAVLGKLVTLVISPLGTALLLGLVGWLVARSSRREPGAKTGRLRAGRAMVAAAVAWLLFWSLPITSSTLLAWVERDAGPPTVEAVAPAPVMVVLGGGVSGPRLPLRPYPDLNSASDRLWHAVRLYRAGKAPRLLLSGGVTRKGDGSEAEAMRRFLLDMGVPDSAMTLEGGSQDTSANATETARLLKGQGVDTVVLVTSASHMPRARKLFERAGLKVNPAPTDFEVTNLPFDVLKVLPDATALDVSARAFKEIVGRAVGR